MASGIEDRTMNSQNPCRRASGNLRAWFATAAEAEAFAADPANWPTYLGDIAVLCLKPGCDGWHLSQPSWPDAVAAAKAMVN
jgi:hypothetical protein